VPSFDKPAEVMSADAVASTCFPEHLAALRDEILAEIRPGVSRVVPDLSSLAASFAYGEIWSRSDLAQRDRSIATFAALVAQNNTEELRLHTVRGMANGLTTTEIGAILTQLVPYVGFPLVMAAAARIADLVERADSTGGAEASGNPPGEPAQRGEKTC
jgi:4-carboxymuconolactone decarboxylase